MFKLIKKLIRYAFLIAVCATILGWYFVIGPHGGAPGKDFNTGENGIWIQHAWVGNEQDPQAVYDLALKLQKYDIKYIYIHTGPFDADGTIPEERYKFAKEFLRLLKEKNPNLIPLAWVGQVRSELEIESEDVRKNIVAVCEKLITEIGFNGLHYDIEPIPHGDEYFLTLLGETRVAVGENIIISVAADEWQPSTLSDIVGLILDENIKSYWETTYFEDVAKIADQIAVMTYDTSLTDPEHYEWFVEQQIIYLTQILAEYDTELLIGIPTYEDDKEGFDPLVENMETGLNGIIAGLNNKRAAADVFTGVAIYADWETSEQEWDIYEKLWQGI